MTSELVPLGMGVPQIASAFAASGLFKDAQDEAKAITKIIAGRALGLDPFSSMSGIHVMQGKVEVGAHLIAAAIKRSGKYDYRVEAKTDTLCRVAFYEGENKLGVEEYTIADAERAQLTRNPTWSKHPKAMLFARAISSGYRTYCPDVFMAPVYVDGEISEEPQPVKTVQNLSRGGEPRPVAEDVRQIRAEVVEPDYDGPEVEALAHALSLYEDAGLHTGANGYKGAKQILAAAKRGEELGRATKAAEWLLVQVETSAQLEGNDEQGDLPVVTAEESARR